jgi:nonsense-mediated mRNA decay protein 3
VLGYDVSGANIPDDKTRILRTALPDVVLVRKSYGAGGGGQQKRRGWRLRSLEKDAEAELTKREAAAQEQDYERFMQQLEGDKEMRRQINLFKDLSVSDTNNSSTAVAVAAAAAAAAAAGGEAGADATAAADAGADSDSESEPDEEQITLDELLDDLTLDDANAAPDSTNNNNDGEIDTSETAVFDAGSAPAANFSALPLDQDDDL